MKKRRREIDEARDGEVVRVPLNLMDAVQRGVYQHYTAVDARNHQPGFRSSNAPEVQTAHDAARASRDAWLNRTTSAWRGPQSIMPNENNTQTDARAAAISARNQKIQRMRDSWRQPFTAAFRDAPQPDTSNLDPDDPDDDNGQDAVERRRAREHATGS
jgi:hypothetical protein